MFFLEGTFCRCRLLRRIWTRIKICQPGRVSKKIISKCDRDINKITNLGRNLVSFNTQNLLHDFKINGGKRFLLSVLTLAGILFFKRNETYRDIHDCGILIRFWQPLSCNLIYFRVGEEKTAKILFVRPALVITTMVLSCNSSSFKVIGRKQTE